MFEVNSFCPIVVRLANILDASGIQNICLKVPLGEVAGDDALRSEIRGRLGAQRPNHCTESKIVGFFR